MAATEASAAPVVQDGAGAAEGRPEGAEPPAEAADSETVNGQVADKDGRPVNSEEATSKDNVNDDMAVVGRAGEDAADGDGGPLPGSENASSSEPRTSFLDSFLNKSGLGKVMASRKRKEQGTVAGGDDGGTEGGAEKDGEKDEEQEGGEEGQVEGEAVPDSEEKDEEKKVEKAKGAEPKSSVRDLIRKPVARIFSHRSTEKKDGGTEPQKQVRSKSLDRLQDPEALNAAADSAGEDAGPAGMMEGGADIEQKASAFSATKHMKRWHSFKKLMVQKTHKKGGGGEEGKEDGGEGEGGGGGDSSTLDSKESGQKRWKLKRSWTFQGLKRDPSMVVISSKTRSSDKDLEQQKGEDGEGGAEETGPDGGLEEAKTNGGDEKVDAGEEEKAAGGGTVTQHANEIWTSFKKRVIPKSKRAHAEGGGGPGEDDSPPVAPAGDEGVEELRSSKTKRSHFGRAVSLKNFILRKGKSTSVDLGDGAKEEEEQGAGKGAEPAEEESQANASEKEAAEENMAEVEKTAADAPVTNGANGCSNGTAEENSTHNHQEEHQEVQETTGSPLKKAKDGAGANDEPNAKIISTSSPVNSGEFQQDRQLGGGERMGEEDEEETRKRDLRQAAVVIVQSVMSAATDQLERELSVSNGLNGRHVDDPPN